MCTMFGDAVLCHQQMTGHQLLLISKHTEAEGRVSNANLVLDTPTTMQDGEDTDEEAQARELAGLKVKHTADELQEGETMILTLADKNILDDKGDLSDGEDELENVLAVGNLPYRRKGACHSLCEKGARPMVSS